MMVLSWPLPVLLAGLLVSLGAGVVRGFAGFGYSALTVAGISLFVAPATVVPAVLALEIVASISMLRVSLRDADHDWLRWLLLGNLLFIPVGIVLLAVLPATVLRLLVGSLLLLSAVGLRRAGNRVLSTSTGLRVGTGVVSGLLNGVAASGGIAAAMLMAATRVPAERLRGTIVTFLLCAGSYALLCAGLLPQFSGGVGARLLSTETLRWVLLLAPPMLLGIWLGKRSFAKVTSADPATYRIQVLNLLIVISGLGVLRAGFEWLAP